MIKNSKPTPETDITKKIDFNIYYKDKYHSLKPLLKAQLDNHKFIDVSSDNV